MNPPGPPGGFFLRYKPSMSDSMDLTDVSSEKPPNDDDLVRLAVIVCAVLALFFWIVYLAGYLFPPTFLRYTK